MKKTKKILSLVLAIAMILVVASCASDVTEIDGIKEEIADKIAEEVKEEVKEEVSDEVTGDKAGDSVGDDQEQTKTGDSMANNPIVEIEMENGGKIKIELYPEIAPKSVENFLKLVNDGFYDGLIFHRVINDFMIQGGDPEGTGGGGPGWSIEGEFASNSFQNDLLHEAGVLSMARTMDPNSAGSQFYIVTNKHASHLDGEYAAFGKVMDEASMEIVYAIEKVQVGMNDKPVEDQVIKSIKVVG